MPVVLNTSDTDLAHLEIEPRLPYLKTIELKSGMFHHIFNDGHFFTHILSFKNKPNSKSGWISRVAGIERKEGLSIYYSKSKITKKGYGEQLYSSVIAYHNGILSDITISMHAHGLYKKLEKNKALKSELGPRICVKPKRVKQFRAQLWI